MNEIIDILENELRNGTKNQPKSLLFWEDLSRLEQFSVSDFATFSAGIPRKIGREKFHLSENLEKLIKKNYPSLLDKSAGFYGRFLIAVKVKNGDCVSELITRGCDEEQAAAIMALNFRTDGASYKDIVVHACRTNSTLVHSAVSQDNPYPAKFFGDQEFKQLVIKTIFMGLDFDRIVNLESRYSGDLGKSLTDFFEERRAAGRWLPDNVLEFMKKNGLIK